MSNQIEMFGDLPIEPVYPIRLRMMHRMYGENGGHRCATCIHLVARRYANTYYKCDLTIRTMGPATDWRTSWPACGRYESRQKEML